MLGSERLLRYRLGRGRPAEEGQRCGTDECEGRARVRRLSVGRRACGQVFVGPCVEMWLGRLYDARCPYLRP